MNERIQNCFVDGNFLFDDFKEKNLFLNCSLDKIVFEKESDYFIRVDFLDGNDEVLRESIIEGDSSKEANCFIGDEVEGEDLPKCFSYEKVVYYFADGKKEAKIKILSASNQKGSKVLR
jgi:hypothetical protein